MRLKIKALIMQQKKLYATEQRYIKAICSLKVSRFAQRLLFEVCSTLKHSEMDAGNKFR